MKIKKEMEYEYLTGKHNNTDSYGSAVYRYLERWAELMEKKIDESDCFAYETICKYAEELSHAADSEGITGFMYGCAVSILSKAWQYGEELRKWHNKEYGYEGDGVVNPAILTVGESKE